MHGFRSFAAQESGEKRRLRAESFADHYSQARQFYLSQTETERRHIANAFVFELSKVEKAAIRARMVAGLVNVDEDLAATVADGLGLAEVPRRHRSRRPGRRLPQRRRQQEDGRSPCPRLPQPALLGTGGERGVNCPPPIRPPSMKSENRPGIIIVAPGLLLLAVFPGGRVVASRHRAEEESRSQQGKRSA